MKEEFNPQTHKKRHEELHLSLNELVADFIACTRKLPSKTTVFELMEWSSKQTQRPSEPWTKNHD